MTKIRDLNKIRPFILVCLGLAIIADGVFTIFPEINGSIGYNTASYLVIAAMAVYLFLSTQTSFSSEKTLQLTLDECIDHALRENLDMKVYHLGLRSYELSTVQAESYFDPSISWRMGRDESVTPNYFEYFEVKSEGRYGVFATNKNAI